MSVESEILRIQHNIADTYAAVADKGGEVPLQPTSANLAAAVASIPTDGGAGAEIYSTEETRIGTWIDGKPIYRITFSTTSPNIVYEINPIKNVKELDIDTIVRIYGINIAAGNTWSIPDSHNDLLYSGENICMVIRHEGYGSRPIIISIEYTKATD